MLTAPRLAPYTCPVKPIRGGLAWGLGVALLLAILPATSWATYPGANGRIAYTGFPASSRDGDIFSILPNGSGLLQLTDNSLDEGDASWSANGHDITYIRAVPGRYQVFKMDADGQDQVQVTHDNGIDDGPQFSPNGRRIIYSKDNLPTADRHNPRRVSIFTIRPDGTDKRLLVHGGYATWPEYSPDGKRIVFVGSPEGRHADGIWTIDSDGSRPHRLTNPAADHPGQYIYDEYPDWSPDGRHIAFLRCNGEYSIHGCGGDVYLIRADGSYEHPIKAISGENPPAFSPRGNRIALTAFQNDGDCGDIYTISLSGSDRRAITHNCDDPGQGAVAAKPNWQPIPPP
jgi:Tol biopolymer transport system component